MAKRPAASICMAEPEKSSTCSVVANLTSGVFLSSSTARLQGVPELTAALIMVERAPALIDPHKVGLLIAILLACERAPVLLV